MKSKTGIIPVNHKKGELIMNKLIAMYVAVQSRIQSTMKDERGATMVEYALMVALIAVALIGAVQGLEGGIDTTFGNAVASL